ncbi:2-dehydro-3-deoxygalactonokinase [Saccharopolyspora sp. NFXS83]|uniref:2-dehydro-3-deoxygalactonokinase n=1 Tax=Saccharopolyspora sp. NFXS83 TaxID=2993560 RepID=UPI00224B3AE3|nr:2-dehydro-3-deoxygalactonokinase [Saccharopolyspora sp. NFXS83]MCX2729253.1 2-dehydro-3-deoxygalactonokinase [Saccharopolyspora sp. NFXS83]
MTDAAPSLIALDWGTTAQRAWLLDDEGGILATRRPELGLLPTTAGLDVRDAGARARAYEAAFWSACGEWVTAHPELPVLACGMVGSAQGWAEAGYLTVPAELRFGADALTRVEHRRGVAHLVPGLRTPSQDGRPGDVIRGEETQIVGALEALGSPAEPVTLVLPGTHGKWVRVAGGEVVSFATAMSGELFGLLTTDGILARTAAGPRRDDEAFARGLAAAAADRSRGLSTELFGARPLVLDGLLDPASVPDYVSGVLIADEVGHLAPTVGVGRVVLCGAEDLCRRYAAALAAHDIVATALTEDVAARGLWRIALSTGIRGRRGRNGAPGHD